MTRLADYFMVIGYRDRDSDEGGSGSGILLQRFPTQDWPDEPFMNNMEVDEEVDVDRSLLDPLHPSFHYKGKVYEPKVLCIASRLNLSDTFRYCLGTIYSAFLERSPQTQLEVLIGNLLGRVFVPPPGGPRIGFSIGRGDVQFIQPPLSSNLPVTGTSVALLLQQIGINNLLVLVSGVLTEQKILFHSRSTSRLHDACGALSALMFPFKWLHTFIPLLPGALLEVVQSPTPFLIGILSQAKEAITESLGDVIQVDLDGGSIHVPLISSTSGKVNTSQPNLITQSSSGRGRKRSKDGRLSPSLAPNASLQQYELEESGDEGFVCDLVPPLPSSLWTEASSLLNAVLHPELESTDHAFPPLAVKPSVPFQLDKEIRGIVMRMLARLLQGYRSCLLLVRIYPAPIITFHKAKFLGGRGLSGSQFVLNLLNCQAFNQFLTERGSPFRPVDLWDEIYGALEEQLQTESRDPQKIHAHINWIAEELAENECPNHQHYSPKMPPPPDWSSTKTNDDPFPILMTELVEETIRDGCRSSGDHRYNCVSMRSLPKSVPFGPTALQPLQPTLHPLINNSARRLEVVRTCVGHIFSSRIPLALKSIHAVKKALQTPAAKLVLCRELERHASANCVLLDREQFDLVVLLIQCALQGISQTDEEGVGAALLPLVTSFCRKLGPGASHLQFAFTCVQDHAVWRNQSFWEAAYYSDVQKAILPVYLPRRENTQLSNNSQSTTELKKESKGDVSPMDIAAEELRLLPTLDPTKAKEQAAMDEATLYSQAIHFINRMVYLLTPLEPPVKKQGQSFSNATQHPTPHYADNVSSIISVGESDSVGGESGFEEHDLLSETGIMVTKVVGRFVDKVCGESGVSDEHTRNLHKMIPSVVEMHLETLEGLSRELKRLPPVPRPKIPVPHLLPGEELMLDSIRVILLHDGREIGESSGGRDGTATLHSCPIPAEGALFLTNYRIIFKGHPADTSVAVPVVIRWFPITSITKEKRFTVTEFGQRDQEGSIIRSAIGQLLKIGFEMDVGSELIDGFRKTLQRLRYPPDVFQHFAFLGQNTLPGSPINNNKDKNGTLRVFAKKTLLLTAKKVGVKPKSQSKKKKYDLRTWGGTGGGTLPPNIKYPMSAVDIDEVSLSEDEVVSPSLSSSDPKTVDRMLDRPYAKEWKRLGIASFPRNNGTGIGNMLNKGEAMRFSFANTNYSICSTYPALLVVPHGVSDEALKKVAAGYNMGRFPILTWRHATTKALLLRGAAMNSRGIGARVFRGPNHPGGGMDGTHVEQENFLRGILKATPSSPGRPVSLLALFESNMSLDSLFVTTPSLARHPQEISHHTKTPEIGRKGSSNRLYRAIDTLRTSGGKGLSPSLGWVRSKKSQLKIPGQPFKVPRLLDQEGGNDVEIVETNLPAPPPLYIFMDKAKLKTLKGEIGSRIEFIPVSPCPELSKVRASFKQVLRACSPTSHSSKPEDTFLKAFEKSEWLVHLESLLRVAGAAVDLLDVQGSSVMLSLGDGADLSAQLSSVTQLCLDPFYRTIDGFNVLIEKEWLSFGHKFSERNSMTGIEGYKAKDLITPIFIQFLDLVHQILDQFPLSFEFNQSYLKFLAYHSLSARFRTFLLDSEYERLVSGFTALDDKRASLPRHYKGVDGVDDEGIYLGRSSGANGHQNNLGMSIFEYIEKLNAKSPIFFNFLYESEAAFQVLRPVPNLSRLLIWDFFVEDSMGVGVLWDLELIPPEDSPFEDQEKREDETHLRTLGKKKDPRRVISAAVDIPQRFIPDPFAFTLSELGKLETERGLLRESWKAKWERIDLGFEGKGERLVGKWREVTGAGSLSRIRRLNAAEHRKSTLQILLQGKMARSSDLVSTHSFIKRPFTALEPCAVCTGFLFGKVALECSNCGVLSHEKCVEGLPVCLGEGTISGDGRIQQQKSEQTDTEISGGVVSSGGPPQSFYERFQSPMTEDRAFEGYLFKRGALLKGWRQRWFVLDSTKHQLRYYELEMDPTPKGFIDLSEVKRCGYPECPNLPNERNYQKKPEDPTIFEIKTTKRVYNFMARTGDEALEWIEKIQGCLM